MTELTKGDDERADAIELLQKWKERCRISLVAYNSATDSAIVRERLIGIPATILAALVATSVFAAVSKDPNSTWKVLTGAAALLSAGLSGLQTFLRLAERAERYREAARSYGKVRRKIEQAQLFLPSDTHELRALLNEISEALDTAARGNPNVPRFLYVRAELEVRGYSKARGAQALHLWLSSLLTRTVRSK